jgi:hypothetical protein
MIRAILMTGFCLGLKGTMSEAELRVLKARLRGGILSKARRGELKMPLPVELIYDPAQRVVFDPDKQLQNTLRHFFATFRRTGAAWATVQAFGKEGLKFPRRGQAGSGELIWERQRLSAALRTLHNPRYAGAFVLEKPVPGKILKDDGTVSVCLVSNGQSSSKTPIPAISAGRSSRRTRSG